MIEDRRGELIAESVASGFAMPEMSIAFGHSKMEINKMKISYYSIVYKSCDNPDDYILYNTITKSIVCINREALNIGLSLSEVSYLQENLFISDSINEDISQFQYILNSAKYRSDTLNLTLIMTYLCNFKCVYCYEQGVQKNTTFSADICDALANWVKSILKIDPTIKKIDICFHGGEPLLALNPIIEICTKFSSLFSKKYELVFHMISNGSLLTEEVATILEQIGISKIQVTIDGMQSTHDKRRMFKDGAPSFTMITNNIISLLRCTSKLRIHINIAVDNQNIGDIDQLLAFLSTLDSEGRISVYISEITKPLFDNRNYQGEAASYKEFTRYYTILNIENSRVDKEFDLCTARGGKNFVIDPEGDIYKCISGVGLEKFLVGSIFEEYYYTQLKQAKFVEDVKLIFSNKCKLCRFLPLCLGGCFYERNSIDNQNICKKSSIRKIIFEKVRLYYNNGQIKQALPEEISTMNVKQENKNISIK